MVIDAECPGYLEAFDSDIEGKMTYVFATWDNRDGEAADFECEGSCPEPASSCDNAAAAFKDIKFYQWGSNWDPTEDEEEEEEEEEIEPPQFESLIGEIDDYGTWEFYVKGLYGSTLETDGDTLNMYENNRAWVLDHAYDDSVFWAYKHKYQGGSVTFDVDMSEVGCGCAAGVYLAKLDDDECTWGAYEPGTRPQCASVDVMEANKYGFNTASYPCEFGVCEEVSQCQRRAQEVDRFAYGPGLDYTIDTTKSFTVKTQFFTNEDETEEYTDITSIKTVLSQEGREVTLEQDCDDYLDPLSW